MQHSEIVIANIKHGLEFRLRPVDQDHVATLAAKIDADGLLVPIIVRQLPDKSFKLIAGRHRLSAVEALGWTRIRANIFPSTGDDKLDRIDDQLFEIAENMARKELGHIEFGRNAVKDKRLRGEREEHLKLKFAAKQAEKEKSEEGKVSGKTRKAAFDARYTLAKISSPEGNARVHTAGTAKFTVDLARSLGKTTRAVQDDIAVYHKAEEAAEKLGIKLDDMVGTKLDQKEQLRALADLAKTVGVAKAAPVVANAIQSAKDGNAAVSLVKARTALERELERDNRDASDPSDPLERTMKELVSDVNTAKAAITLLASKFHKAGLKHEEVRDMMRGLRDHANKHSDFWVSTATSLRTGTRAKLKGAPAQPGKTPAEREARAKAKADQEANATTSRDELLKKGIR